MSTHTLHLAEASLENAGGRDRRRSERVPYVLDAWLASPTSTDPADGIEVTAMDLSRHGVAFTSKCPVPVGTFYILTIGIGSQKLISEVRTVSCRTEDKQVYEVGAEFC